MRPAAPAATVPVKFSTDIWGDGSLFYRGLPEVDPVVKTRKAGR